jgi:hypothetical protein
MRFLGYNVDFEKHPILWTICMRLTGSQRLFKIGRWFSFISFKCGIRRGFSLGAMIEIQHELHISCSIPFFHFAFMIGRYAK